MSYQLTIELASGTQYSFSYILSNLYLYLLSPLLPSWSFPFFPTKHFQPGVVPGWASLPVGKGFEDVFTGLLPSVPLVWLLIPLVLALVVFYSITRNNPPVYESTPLFQQTLVIDRCINNGWAVAIWIPADIFFYSYALCGRLLPSIGAGNFPRLLGVGWNPEKGSHMAKDFLAGCKPAYSLNRSFRLPGWI